MSKLTDKIEGLLKFMDEQNSYSTGSRRYAGMGDIDTGRFYKQLDLILADVCEMERTVENQRAALAVREGELSAEISHSKRATQGLNTVAAASASAIRQAKREAYEYALQLTGQYKTQTAQRTKLFQAIDALDVEGVVK